jgi:hypothetical protein
LIASSVIDVIASETGNAADHQDLIRDADADLAPTSRVISRPEHRSIRRSVSGALFGKDVDVRRLSKLHRQSLF